MQKVILELMFPLSAIMERVSLVSDVLAFMDEIIG